MLKKFSISLMAGLLAVVAMLSNASPVQAALSYMYASGTWAYSAGTVPHQASANLTIWKPTVTAGDFHSVSQIAVQSQNSNQIVEVGWNVDNALYGDNEPHVFVHYWKDGFDCGYNGVATPANCGSIAAPWVDNAAVSMDAGDELTESISGGTVTTLKVGIDYSTTDCGGAPNGWWVRAWYSTGTAQYIGCYKDTNWSGVSPTFNNFHLYQAFGEVAVNVANPTTLMGSGVCPAAVPVFNTTAFIGSVSTNLGLTTLSFNSTHPTKYKHQSISSSSFYMGGDGSC